MKTLILVIIAVVVILGIFGLMVMGTYNSMVSLDQNVYSKWSEVESQYQRQADLILNLISVVSSSVRVETNFTKTITDARTKWMSASTPLEKDTAGVDMSNGVANFMNLIATAENYPVLQANKQYVALTDEISGTQNRITVARGRYIEAIRDYNTAIKTFPGNMFAGMFGFIEKEYYAAEVPLTTPPLGTGVLP